MLPAIAQLALLEEIVRAARPGAVLVGVESMRLERPVGPSRTLRVEVETGDEGRTAFEVRCENRVVSRGTLPFIPDIAKCLREVDRVLKPSGVALLGGRYLYTPQRDKLSSEKLREIVASSGVAGAQVVEGRGQ